MKILSFDPAGDKFGVAGILFEDGVLDLYLEFLLEAPSTWNVSKKNSYMANSCAMMAVLDKPDVVVSEKPFGIGYSAQSLKELIGAIKAEMACNISWQGVSEARMAVLGEGYGGSDKKTTAEWLLQYPWKLGAKRTISQHIASANPETKEGYDVLDAILHGVCYLVKNAGLVQKPKPVKVKKKSKKKSAELTPDPLLSKMNSED